MKRILIGMAALPFLFGVAAAGQPLTGQQMDRVTAGFAAISIADAEGLAGESGIVFTATGSLSQVLPLATAHLVVNGVPSEAGSTLYKSLAASQSSTITQTYVPGAIPGFSLPPPLVCGATC